MQFDHDSEPTVRAPALLIGYYVAAVLLVITLLPFNFQSPATVSINLRLDTFDAIANVCLFVPFGFLIGLAAPARLTVIQGCGAGLALSLAIEALQLSLPERVTGASDLATNALGAGLGMWLYKHLRARPAAALLRRLALHLPLTLLACLLTPLLWLSALTAKTDPTRLWLTAPLALATACILVAIWRHRLRHALPPTIALGIITLWLAVALAPAFGVSPLHAGATGLLCACVILAGWIGGPALHAPERRFEGITLRPVLWLFATFLGLSAAWPLPWPGIDLSLHPGLAGDAALRTDALRLLERIAAMTVAGYLVAESRGRVDTVRNRMPLSVVFTLALTALACELILGARADAHVSLFRMAIGFAAALYGALTYRLQLFAVRAAVCRPSSTRVRRRAQALVA